MSLIKTTTTPLSYFQSEGQDNSENCVLSLQAENNEDSCIVLEPEATDIYKIKLKNSNLYLTVRGTGANSDVCWEAPVNLNAGYDNLASQEWRFVEFSTKGFRAPLIYAGYYTDGKAYSYTDAQLRGLGNATEFVICSGVFGEYFTPDGYPTPYTGDNASIQGYVIAAVEMVRRLRLIYPNKPVWIGTPLVGGNVPYTNSTAYAEVGRRMTYFVDNIISQFALKNLSFDSCVKGFYMSNEGVMNPFHANSTIADNCEVSMFQTLSNYVSAKGKKMLWIPCWNSDNAIIKTACVAQRTNIFDYVLIQPGHYFSRNDKNKCLAIRKSIQTKTVCKDDANLSPVLSNSQITCSKAVIGCQMEIDSKYSVSNTYGQAYAECVDIFSTSVGAYSKATTNFGFYFECPWSSTDSAYNTIKQKVNAFFA